MINLLFNQKTPGKVGNLTFDVLLSEQPTYTNEVTTFPIEDGSLISDGVTRQPLRLALAGLVTNSPLWQGFGLTSFYDSFRSSSLGQATVRAGTRCDDALQALLKMCGRVSPVSPGVRQSRQPVAVPVTVVTGLQVYQDMVVTSLVFDRDASTGDALPFVLNLVEVTKVSFSQVFIKYVGDANKAKLGATTDVGKVQPKAATQKTSILAGMYKRVLGGR
jgi:hypothetical protein